MAIELLFLIVYGHDPREIALCCIQNSVTQHRSNTYQYTDRWIDQKVDLFGQSFMYQRIRFTSKKK